MVSEATIAIGLRVLFALGRVAGGNCSAHDTLTRRRCVVVLLQPFADNVQMDVVSRISRCVCVVQAAPSKDTFRSV